MTDKIEDPDWPDLWQMIDDRRSELGLSLGELYDRSGVSQRTFADMRKGRPLQSRAKLAGICKALRWPPDAIEHFWLDGERPWSIEFAIERASELLSTSEFYASESGSGEEIREYRWAKSNITRLLQWRTMLDDAEKRRAWNAEFKQATQITAPPDPVTPLDALAAEVRQLAQAVEYLAEQTGVDLSVLRRGDPGPSAAAQ